jgi:hypothetical protein
MDANEQEFFEERAAIMEFDGLLTREEAERRGKLETEEYRHACEVREIASWPLQARRAHITGVEHWRGKAAADRIKSDLLKLWEKRK